MHSPNASLRGSSLSPTFESTEKSENDLYLLYSTVNSFNSSPNALHTLYSLVTGNKIDVDIALENESSAIFLADYEGNKVTTTLASLNESWPLGESGAANLTELEEVLGPVRDPFFTVLLMTIVYTFILVTGVCGNLLTCLVIARRRYMHTATNYYLFSLSISDLLLLILGLPQDMVLLWQKYPYIFSEAFCILRGLTSEICTNCSILVIVGFTIERYIAICHPLISHTTLKLSRVVKIIALTWVIGTLSAIPIAWQFGIVYVYNQNQQPYPGSDHCAVKRLIYPYIFELTTMVFFVLPITIIIVLYILIGIKLRASSTGSDRQIKGTRKGRVSSTGKSLESRPPLSMSIRRQNNSRRAVIRMLVAVVIAFFFCFAPFHAQRVLAIVMNRNEVSDDKFIQIFTILTHISGVTYYLSSVLNPILYQVMSKKFQLALRETLPCCTKLADPNDADLAFSTVLPTSRQGNSHSPNHASKQASFYSSSSPKKLADSKS